MAHSLLAAEIGGALGGRRGRSWGERFRVGEGPRSQSPYNGQGSWLFAKSHLGMGSLLLNAEGKYSVPSAILDRNCCSALQLTIP